MVQVGQKKTGYEDRCPEMDTHEGLALVKTFPLGKLVLGGRGKRKKGNK